MSAVGEMLGTALAGVGMVLFALLWNSVEEYFKAKKRSTFRRGKA